MKKLLALTLIVFCFIRNHSHSQTLTLDWSEKIKYTNSKDGFFDEFIGAADGKIFVLHNNFTISENKKYNTLKIVAYKKSNMTRIGHVILKGNKVNEKRENQLKEMKIRRVFEKNDNIYVLWTKEEKSKVEIYGEVYDIDLELIEKLKPIYSLDIPKGGKKGNTYAKVSPFIMKGNGAAPIIIGCEVHKGKNENISFNYALLDSTLNEKSKSENELTIVQTKKNSSFSSSYFYGNDGMIYLLSTVGYDLESAENEDKKKGKKSKKGLRGNYSVLSMINPETEEFQTQELNFSGYNIDKCHLRVTENITSIYGFFRDEKNDTKKKDKQIQGIFHVTIDPKKFELSDPHFSYFSKRIISDLFKDDPDNKKNSTGLNSKNKKLEEEEDTENTLDGEFTIEDAKPTDDGGIVIFNAYP